MEAQRAAVVTVSDGVSRGVRDDASGRAVSALLEDAGFVVVRREVVPDEQGEIEALLRSFADEGIPLVVTTGGTGLGPRDVTPEATRTVIDRDAPGLAELMRSAGRESTPMAALSRGAAGSRGETLFLNLPGSERGARESLTAVMPLLPHAVELLSGRTVHGPASAHPPNHLEAPGIVGAVMDAHAGHSLEQQLADRRHAGEAVILGTAVRVEGNPPCRVGQKILVGAGGALGGTLGCAEFDDAAVADAPEILERRVPGTRTYTHDLGSVEVFLEPFVPGPALVVVSATPVALHLLRWGRELGFDPVLVEPRQERITPEHRAAATRVVGSIDELPLDQDTSVAHTDHDAPGVAESVGALLRSNAGFIGVMGSRRHVGPYVEALRANGFSNEDLARIRSPLGLDIGARTTQEIALSILTGVVAARRNAEGGWLDR